MNLIEMPPSDKDVRAFLIAEALRFIERIVGIPGVRRVAMLGSLLGAKANPKDVVHAACHSPPRACAICDVHTDEVGSQGCHKKKVNQGAQEQKAATRTSGTLHVF